MKSELSQDRLAHAEAMLHENITLLSGRAELLNDKLGKGTFRDDRRIATLLGAVNSGIQRSQGELGMVETIFGYREVVGLLESQFTGIDRADVLTQRSAELEVYEAAFLEDKKLNRRIDNFAIRQSRKGRHEDSPNGHGQDPLQEGEVRKEQSRFPKLSRRHIALLSRSLLEATDWDISETIEDDNGEEVEILSPFTISDFVLPSLEEYAEPPEDEAEDTPKERIEAINAIKEALKAGAEPATDESHEGRIVIGELKKANKELGGHLVSFLREVVDPERPIWEMPMRNGDHVTPITANLSGQNGRTEEIASESLSDMEVTLVKLSLPPQDEQASDGIDKVEEEHVPTEEEIEAERQRKIAIFVDLKNNMGEIMQKYEGVFGADKKAARKIWEYIREVDDLFPEFALTHPLMKNRATTIQAGRAFDRLYPKDGSECLTDKVITLRRTQLLNGAKTDHIPDIPLNVSQLIMLRFLENAAGRFSLSSVDAFMANGFVNESLQLLDQLSRDHTAAALPIGPRR